VDYAVFVAEGSVSSFVVPVGEYFEKDGGLGEEKEEHGLEPVWGEEHVHVVQGVGEFAGGAGGVVGEGGEGPQVGGEAGGEEGEGAV
jgi:hypothetical protein